MGRHLTSLAPLLLLAGCFNPESTGDFETDTDMTSGTEAGSTSMTTATATATTTATATATATTTTDPTSTSTTDPTDPTDPTAGSTGSMEVCGDGTVDDTEACDDGNTASGDGCSAACQDETSFCEPRVIGTFTNDQDPLGHVAEAGEFVAAVQTSANPAVVLIDITDPADPLFQTALNLNQVDALDLIARPDRVFVIGNPLATALTINAGALAQVDQIDGSNEYGFQATLQGTAIFVADDATTRVINAAQPGNLNLTSANVNLQGLMFPSYDGIASAPNRVYVSANGQLGAFDISDPFDPALLGTVSMTGGGGGPLRVTEDGNYVVNEASDGVGIYDVSDASQPAFVSVAAVPQANVSARNVATRGTFVYVPTSNGRVFTFDIADPEVPVDAANVDVGDTPAIDVHPGQDFLYVIENGTVHLLADLPGYCDAVCGNGSVEYPEACDDGDLESGDECDADCTL